MMDYTISSKISNETVYACYRGRFWRWDGSIWKESHLMTQKFERAKAADKKLTPQAFLTNGAEFAPLDEYEIDCAMLDALENAKPCKNAPIDPVEEDSSSGVPASCICSTCTCGGCKEECFGNCHSCGHPVQECNSYQTEGEKHLTPAHSADVDKPEVPGTQTTQNKPLTTIPDEIRPAFDYSGLDAQTVDDLHFAEKEYQHGKKLAERGLVHMGNAIAAAHDALCGTVVQQLDNGQFAKKDDTFRAWCCSIGITKSTAYNLLQVSALMDGSSPRQRAILEALPPTLLYAVAKPSAPAELVEKVKNGEVSTNKEYQDLLAQIKVKEDELAKTQADLDHEISQNDALLDEKGRLLRECEASKKARMDAENRADTAEGSLTAAMADVQGLTEQNARLNAEKEQAEARAHKAEDALKHQPITAVVDEEEVDRRATEKAWGLADARNRELQEENDRLKKNSAQLERRMKAVTSRMDDLGQTDFETANHCPEAMLAIWNSCKGSYSRLTGEDLENTFQYICNTLNSIRQEAALLCRQPEGYDGGAA